MNCQVATHTETLDELMEQIKEAIELYVEVEPDVLQKEKSQSVGIYYVKVSYDRPKGFYIG